MNERIQELGRQASLWCDQNIPGEFSEETMGYGHHWEQKFAELIVRECANLFPLTFTDEQYQRRIDKTILKHFGVDQ
jgi:hypothetical protein